MRVSTEMARRYVVLVGAMRIKCEVSSAKWAFRIFFLFTNIL